MIHGDEYARGAALDFAVNVDGGPRPEWLSRAIAHGAAQLARYPDDRMATEAAARRHGRDSAEVVILNGAAEAFTLLARALRPRCPLVVHPSFTEPERALRDAGLRPRRLISAEPFALDPEAVPGDADLVIVGNPCNPTGVLHPRERLEQLCRHGRVTVVDEAFIEFVPAQRESLAGDAGTPGLVVVRSLTKVLGLPGVRAGYLLAPPPLAAALKRAQPKWPLNSVALAVIEAAAERPEHFEQAAARTEAHRLALSEALRDAARVFPSSANFLLLELADAVATHRRLRAEHGIATRPAWTFPGLDRRHLRVAVRGQPLDGRLAAALSGLL